MARTVRRLQPVACPQCGSTRVGRIGAQQYYCGDCCLELQLCRDRVELFAVDEEGNLVSIGQRPLDTLRTSSVSAATAKGSWT